MKKYLKTLLILAFFIVGSVACTDSVPKIEDVGKGDGITQDGTKEDTSKHNVVITIRNPNYQRSIMANSSIPVGSDSIRLWIRGNNGERDIYVSAKFEDKPFVTISFHLLEGNYDFYTMACDSNDFILAIALSEKVEVKSGVKLSLGISLDAIKYDLINLGKAIDTNGNIVELWGRDPVKNLDIVFDTNAIRLVMSGKNLEKIIKGLSRKDNITFGQSLNLSNWKNTSGTQIWNQCYFRTKKFNDAKDRGIISSSTWDSSSVRNNVFHSSQQRWYNGSFIDNNSYEFLLARLVPAKYRASGLPYEKVDINIDFRSEDIILNGNKVRFGKIFHIKSSELGGEVEIIID